MSWGMLAGPLVDAGLTILGTAIGGPAGTIATTVGKAVAKSIGVSTPEAVEEAIRTDPKAVETLARLEAERADEWLALAKAGQELQAMLAEREGEQGFFAWGWRPAMSWLVVAIVANQFLAAPVINAALGADLAAPYEHVLGVAAIWLTIYGGGHTVKSIFGNRLSVPGVGR